MQHILVTSKYAIITRFIAHTHTHTHMHTHTHTHKLQIHNIKYWGGGGTQHTPSWQIMTMAPCYCIKRINNCKISPLVFRFAYTQNITVLPYICKNNKYHSYQDHLHMIMAIPCRRGFLGRLMVSSCRLIAASEAKWTLAGQAGFLDNFFIWHIVLPLDAKDGVQAALMKLLKQPDLLLLENPGLCIVQEGRNDDGSVYLDLCGQEEWMTLPYSLWQSSKRSAGFEQAVLKILADRGIMHAGK